MTKNAVDWSKYPQRACYSMHECRVCGETIGLGQIYRDGGHGRRAHVGCAEFPLVGQSESVHNRPDRDRRRRTKPLDYSQIDEGIRGLVQSLRYAGFVTTSSCQGGEGHDFPLPTVRIEYRKRNDYIHRIIAHMQSLGIACTVSLQIPTQASRIMPEGRFFQVELWSVDQISECPAFEAGADM